ncbi:MAG TPA: SRPBCC domain-containing protein [Jiangellaceae bacterium]|nr:SRPBCC domain-containing protein [Jiangellaceae bacterium]
MTVTNVEKDFERLTLTVVAHFDAPVEQVWQLWSDPRKLERWWGPQTYPATVQAHDLSIGGTVRYYMTGPDGDMSRGWWRITSVDPPKHLEFIDGFADEHGAPVAEAPTTTMQVRLTEHDGGTRMEVRSIYSSREHMEQIARLGAIEIFVQSLGQMDALLAG